MERCADPASQLVIDEWILDYLVYMSLKAILMDYKSARSGAHNARLQGETGIPLQMVDYFLSVFRMEHPGHHGSLDLRFRLRNLRFAAMYTRRMSHLETTPSRTALQRLRDRRQCQAMAFRSNDQRLASLDPLDLNEHSSSPHNAPIRTEHFFQEQIPQDVSLDVLEPTPSLIPRIRNVLAPTLPRISLLDSLPSFMALSAVESSMKQTTITDTWMRLAAGYMAQAVIEQYLVYGATSHKVLKEAFAWGFDSESSAEEGSEEWEINAMFFGEDDVLPGWEELRDAHMQALKPPAGIDLYPHLRRLIENELSIPKFEECMIDFLDGLLRDQPMPTLAQVEIGKVDGLSRSEARALQQAIGMFEFKSVH